MAVTRTPGGWYVAITGTPRYQHMAMTRMSRDQHMAVTGTPGAGVRPSQGRPEAIA